MEIEQLIKQLNWLDEERRSDKTRIATLEERLAALEGNIPPLARQLKDIGGEVTRLEALLARMDHFDEALLQQRVESKQVIDELERELKKRGDEAEKLHRVQFRAVDTSIAEFRKELEQLPEIKRNLKSRVEEESRLARLIDETRAKIDTSRHSEEEYTRAFRLLDDGRRQDVKRLTDLQGEVAAIRKRVDENRGKIELLTTSTKKVEVRVGELASIESERKETIEDFVEKQTLYQVERDRVWKEWEARIQTIEAHTTDVETNLQALEATHRAVKRTQQTVDEIAQKVERRINELTEIQRLSEERFRQEWVTFKADDQKRWTNYTLTIEEQRNESARQFEKLTEKVALLGDSLQQIEDIVAQINEQSEKRLQSLLAMSHEWVASYERSIGRNR